MGDAQQWTVIVGGPTVIFAALGIMTHMVTTALGSQFDTMNARFDAVDSRFDAMESRFAGIDSRFERLEDRVDNIDRDVATLTRTLVGGGE